MATVLSLVDASLRVICVEILNFMPMLSFGTGNDTMDVPQSRPEHETCRRTFSADNLHSPRTKLYNGSVV